MNGLVTQFIRCHEGSLNRLLHIIGFSLVGLGIIDKSYLYAISGAIIQELGHIYQFVQTKNPKDSPLTCIKPQSIFAYPVFILILIYIGVSK